MIKRLAPILLVFMKLMKILIGSLFLFWASILFAQAPVISPLQPSVNQGTTKTFTCTANCSTGGTWSCAATNSTGGAATCAGSIGSSSGIYTAPSTVTALASLGGRQLLANDHVYNTRIDSLPVNSNSATWIAGSGTQNLIWWQASKPINYTNGSTPTQSAVFYYTPGNNGSFQIPAFPGIWPFEARIEDGWIGAQINQNSDHHLLTIDTTTGNLQDMYQWYAIGLNGSCPTCNSQSGVQYSAGSYALSGGASSDAAGMYITPLMLRLQDVKQAIASNGTINHALRFTLNQGYCASSFIWPAQTFSADGGTVPFGARFRLKSSFNISGYSAIAQILLTQLKQYGIILADGGTGWSIDTEATKWPTNIWNAIMEISNVNPISNTNLEAVDESSLEVSAASGLTTNNREIITFTRTSDSVTSSTDVALTGVVVSFPYSTNIVQIQVGAPAYQLVALANIGSLTWSMSPSLGTLSTSGLYTPPGSVSVPTAVTVTATSSVNTAVAAQLTVNVFPAGPIRLVPGSVPGVYEYQMVPTTYTDTSGNAWYSIGDDGGFANGCSTITGTLDPTLYCNEYNYYTSGANDSRYDFLVPNGIYQTLAKGAAIFGTVGTAINDLELNGAIVYTNLDWYAASGGLNKAFDFLSSTQVSNNRLSFVIRKLNNSGPQLGALQISQGGTIPAVMLQ